MDFFVARGLAVELLARLADDVARFAAGRFAAASASPPAFADAPAGSSTDAACSSVSASSGDAGAPPPAAPVAAAPGCVIANWAIWLNCDCSRFHQAEASK